VSENENGFIPVTVLDNVIPAKKEFHLFAPSTYRCVFAVKNQTKKFPWSKPTNYSIAHVVFFATVAEIAPNGMRVTDDVVQPIVRVGGRLRPACYVPGFVGMCPPGEPDSLYADEANELVEKQREEEATRQAEAHKKARLNIN